MSEVIFRVLISAEVSGRRRTGRRKRRSEGSLPISTVRRRLNAAVARRRMKEKRLRGVKFTITGFCFYPLDLVEWCDWMGGNWKMDIMFGFVFNLFLGILWR